MDSGSNNSQVNNVGIDFIQEVKIQTSNFSAEYGRKAGAAVNVAFGTDSWKVRRNLSIEFGARFYHFSPTYRQVNNMTSFDPSRYDPAQAAGLIRQLSPPLPRLVAATAASAMFRGRTCKHGISRCVSSSGFPNASAFASRQTCSMLSIGLTSGRPLSS